MHKSQFLTKFKSILKEADTRPVALICAVGGRTAWLQKELSSRGITNILDVSEGMNGSSYGPGWLRSGLPVKKYSTPPGSITSSKTYTFLEGLTGSYRPPWIRE